VSYTDTTRVLDSDFTTSC